jgi:hypothetical protein
MSTQFESLIESTISAINGEVVDKSRVADRLLDLRNDAESPALVEAVDELLRTIPGRSMVATTWWREALEGLRIAAVIEREHSAAI